MIFYRNDPFNHYIIRHGNYYWSITTGERGKAFLNVIDFVGLYGKYVTMYRVPKLVKKLLGE